MKVLIADDNPVSLRLLRTYLEKWSYEVTAAEDGAAAWDLFRAGDFPLVIADWMMPGLDGLELLRRIRDAGRPGYVYCVLLTARADKEDLVQGMEAGADDFLSKPFDRDELRVRLRAGERVVALERAALQQARALRDAHTALADCERLARLGRLAAQTAAGLDDALAAAAADLTALRDGDPDPSLADRALAHLARAGRDVQSLRQAALEPPPADPTRGERDDPP